MPLKVSNVDVAFVVKNPSSMTMAMKVQEPGEPATGQVIKLSRKMAYNRTSSAEYLAIGSVVSSFPSVRFSPLPLRSAQNQGPLDLMRRLALEGIAWKNGLRIFTGRRS